MMRGVVAGLLLTTSTPSIIKIDVAPVSAIAWFVAIDIALRYSDVGLPKTWLAAATSERDVGIVDSAGGEGDCTLVVQLDIFIVASSSSTMMFKR